MHMVKSSTIMCKGVATLAAVFVLLSCSCASADGRARNVHLPRREIVSEAFSHGDEGATLYSSDNYLKCTSDILVSPTTTQEVSDLIRLYTSRHSRVKIRATRRGFHSSAGFVCSGRRDSSKKEHRGGGARDGDVVAVTMLLHLLNRVVDVDEERRRVTVEAGMTLLELAHAAEANAMAVPAGAFSMYANLTVGGVVMASAHGSGLGSVSSLGDLVRAVKWVNAKGEVVVSDVATERGAKEVRGLVGALGLLGVATEFTFQLQENSRTVVETWTGLEDAEIVADVKRILFL
jgi:L-gulonolactone oxidase